MEVVNDNLIVRPACLALDESLKPRGSSHPVRGDGIYGSFDDTLEVSGIRLRASEDCAVMYRIDLRVPCRNENHYVTLYFGVVGLISLEILPLVGSSHRLSLVWVRHLVRRYSVDSVDYLLNRMLEAPGFCLPRTLNNVGGFVVARVHFRILLCYSPTASYSSGSSILFS